MSRSKRTSLKVACCVGVVLGLAGCSGTMTTVRWESDGTPQHTHPNQQWWRYQFVYYPDVQVYFNPFTNDYYWYTGEQWVQSQHLPEWITLDKNLARVVKVYSKPPHLQHRTMTAVVAGPSHGVFPSSANERGGHFAVTTAEPANDH